MDNGSDDRSLDIAQRYKKKYPLALRVLECQKFGAAAARNLGARKAQGDFIWFVDADDTVAPEAVRELLAAAEATDADLVMMGAQRIFSEERSDYLSAVKPDEPNFRSRLVRYGAGPWQFLIRRDWWVREGLKFPEGCIHEDMGLTGALILYTDRYAAVDLPLYHYYQNAGSVLHQHEWNPHEFDIFPVLEGLYQRFKDAGAAEKYHAELEWFFIWNLLIDANKAFERFPEGREGFARTRKMLREYFPRWRQNRFLRQKPWKTRVRIKMNYWK